MSAKTKNTPGQQLWLTLARSDTYAQQGATVSLPPGSTGTQVQQATKKWLEGMSRSLKESFSTGLRERREELNLTQQQLAETADLTVTAVAMIERGERVPSLDTAARLCWALDVAAGVTSEDF